MKNIYILIVSMILFSNQLIVSQTNWSSHSYNDTPMLLTDVNEFQFFITNSRGESVDSTIIIGVRKNGAIKFRYNLNTTLLTFANVKASIKTFDNCLILVGEKYHVCDVMFSSKPCVILKIDTNGIAQLTNTTVVTYTTNAQLEPFTSVVQKPDSSFLVFSADYFHTYSKNGNLIASQTHTLGSVNASAVASNTTILVSHSVFSGTTTLNYLTMVDTAKNIINTVSSNYSFSKMLKNSLGDYYGLTSSNLIVKINNSLSPINTSSLSQGAFLINDFDIKNDTIFACGKNASNQSAVLKFDGGLNSLFINLLNNPNYNFTGITCQTNSLTLIANDWGPTYGNKSVSYFKTDNSGIINLDQDAYVVDYTTNSGYAYSTISSFTAALPSTYYYYSLHVKVFNSGSDTLKSVYLNALPRDNMGNCGTIWYHQFFSGLAIPPNNFGFINTSIIGDYSYTSPVVAAGSNYTLTNICVWTSSPNMKSDANHSNDSYCGNVILLSTTGINEHDLSNLNIQAYPNPTNEKLQFANLSDGLNYTITLFDITGKEVVSKFITKNNNTINIEFLSDGLYVLKISDGVNAIFKKITKLN
jgi:hypothetical protein